MLSLTDEESRYNYPYLPQRYFLLPSPKHTRKDKLNLDLVDSLNLTRDIADSRSNGCFLIQARDLDEEFHGKSIPTAQDQPTEGKGHKGGHGARGAGGANTGRHTEGGNGDASMTMR